MHWEKKICFRLTLKRIVGALLMASIVTNLVIVGAVLRTDAAQAAPTPTSTWTSHQGISTFFTAASRVTLTATQTFEPTRTDTPTATLTSTNTNQPTATSCVMKMDWPVYRIRRGDTLYSIALATGSTVQELMEANCLQSNRIFARQLLYVPRLPATPTPTDTLTPDTPTGFEILATMTCDPPFYVSFSVRAYDPDTILSIIVLVYSGQDTLITELPLAWNGTNYSGSTSLSQQYTVAAIAYYRFRAVDGSGNVTTSQAYRERSSSCPGH